MAGLGGLGKFTELRSRLTFVLLALVVYRIGSYIPVPGVDTDRLLELMNSQKGTIVDMFNMFSGGALHRFSLFALNVVPYISASIVIQLMGQIYGPWKAMKNEGEAGRRKLTQYSRIGAVGLAIVQSFFLARGLQSQGVAYDMIESMPSYLAVVKKVLAGSGECAEVNWTFLGFSMPEWTLLCFVLLGIGALVAGFRKR